MRHRYVSFAVGIVLVIVAAAFLLTGAAAIPGSNAAIETIVISDGNTAPVADFTHIPYFIGKNDIFRLCKYVLSQIELFFLQ